MQIIRYSGACNNDSIFNCNTTGKTDSTALRKREAAAAPMLIGILAAAGIVFLPITPDNTGMMIYIILAVLINSSCIFSRLLCGHLWRTVWIIKNYRQENEKRELYMQRILWEENWLREWEYRLFRSC